jgi:hypothetical protein
MVHSIAHGTHGVQYRPTWTTEIVLACKSFVLQLDEVVSHRDGFHTAETEEN